MEIVHANQVDPAEIEKEHYDIFIFCHSADERWSYIWSNGKISAKQQIMLVFEDHETIFGQKQSGIIELRNTVIRKVSSDDDGSIYLLMQEAVRQCCDGNATLLIDVSCFPRKWLSAMAHYLFVTDEPHERVQIYFAYTPSVLFIPRNLRKLRDASPLMAFSWLANPDSPVALFLILGYDQHTASRLIAKLKPSEVLCFYIDPAFDPRITEEILTRNQKLLKNIPSENIFSFPLTDLNKTDELMTALTQKWRLTHRVIIASMGPKILTLMSLLYQIRYPDIEVWDAGDSELHANATGKVLEPIVYKVLFTTLDHQDS